MKRQHFLLSFVAAILLMIGFSNFSTTTSSDSQQIAKASNINGCPVSCATSSCHVSVQSFDDDSGGSVSTVFTNATATGSKNGSSFQARNVSATFDDDSGGSVSAVFTNATATGNKDGSSSLARNVSATFDDDSGGSVSATS